MNADEIIFGEVQYREPIRARRPDRDPAQACLAYQVPQPDDLPIFLDRGSADAIERHALRDTSVELGGVLLGRECVDEQTGEPFVWVTESLEAKHFENTQASFTYTHDSWEELTRERERSHPDLDIVGWYHTHPDFGIFLSSHDLFLHRNFFPQPLQVAYVIDPIRQIRGFFRWRGDGLEQVGGFWLTAARADRIALARQVNDLESIASADPAGTGFSPRLEAELMAMLTRPHVATQVGAPGDRALYGLLFGGLGLLAGGLVVAAGGWMAMVARQVENQSATLNAIRAEVARSEQVSQAAVATLLARVGSTADPKEFIDELTRSKAALAEAKGQAANQAALASAAASEYRRQSGDLDRSQRAEREATDLVQRLKDQDERKTSQIDELTSARKGWLATDAGLATRKYTIALYAAIAGWVVAAIATAAWALQRWLLADAIAGPDLTSRPTPGERS